MGDGYDMSNMSICYVQVYTGFVSSECYMFFFIYIYM